MEVFTIVANEVIGLSATECTLIQFSYNPEQIRDPETVLRSAVKDYLKTDEGKRQLEINCGCWNWGDVDDIPGSFFLTTIVLPRKNCPSVLLNFLTEPLSNEICIPHSFYYILGRTFNPITRKPLKKISRSLRCCTTKQKNACKTATSGCLVALASKAPII